MSENNHSMESDRRLVTVMFADISGFTAMSEKMDLEEVSEVMKECFSMMEKIIEEYGGTIDKFIGDCVMVLFGAPKAQEDAPHRALNTALDIRKRLQRFNEEKRLVIPLDIHIGINTGPVIAGMMGGDKRQDFTVMGDTVNLASRMESSAKTGEILVAENTYRLAEGYFDFEDVGPLVVKGKEQQVQAYHLIGPRQVKTRIEASLGKGLTPFAGRNLELEHLRSCFEKVKDGHGQIVGVMGEPGMGKTRLIREFTQALPAGEHACLEGGCRHYGDAIPYLPILGILRDYFDIQEDEGESTIKEKIGVRIAQLPLNPEMIIPPLHEILSLKVEDEEYVRLEAKQRREKVFEAIRMLFISESRNRPLVVVVEDLHWIDRSTEEFLTYFIGSLATTHIMLILLYRPEYSPAWANKTYYSQVHVDQLPKKTSNKMVQSILSGAEVGAELNDLITVKSSGNPLFIEELTHSLVENGSIRKKDNRYVLSLKPSDIKVPDTIQGIIAGRLDRLEENLKRVMQVASVIGREFAFRILQSVATLKGDLKASLFTLQDLEFIYEKAFFPELEYIFKHALTQEVAYNSLLIKKRKETHERVGQAIEQIYGDRLEEFYEMLAYHYSLSDNSQKAYEFLKFSGDKATRNYSNWEAIRFYKETIRVLDAQPENEEYKREKLKVCLLIITPMMFLNYPEGSLELFHQAERLAKELHDDKNLAKVYSSLGLCYTLKGNPVLGMEYCEKCFNTAGKIDDIGLITRSAMDVCFTHFYKCDYGEVVNIGRRVLPLFEKHLGEKVSRKYNIFTNTSVLYGQALGFLGLFQEGKAVLKKGFEYAHKTNDNFQIGFMEFSHSILSFFEGDGEATIDHAQRAITCFEQINLDFILGTSWSMLGGGYHLSEEYELARDHAEKGIKLQKKVGIPVNLPPAYWIMASIHLALGDLDSARKCAEEGLKLSREFNQKVFEWNFLILLGRINRKEDPASFDEAQHKIQDAISMFEENNLGSYTALGYLSMGELYADAGRIDEALENLKKAESLFLEMKVTPKSYWLKQTQEAIAKLE